jgi:hypothetical protein
MVGSAVQLTESYSAADPEPRDLDPVVDTMQVKVEQTLPDRVAD